MYALPLTSAVFVLSLLFGVEPASARLPKDSDLSVLVEDEQSEYEVNTDGSYTFTYSTQIAVLTEAGRESEAVKSVQFNSRAAKLEILEAKTIRPDRAISVSKSNIEFKEIGDSKVFDSMKQAIISFPSVDVGSKIYYKYRLTVDEVPMPGFFSAGLGIGPANIDRMRYRVRSRIPLYSSINDPNALLDVKLKEEGRWSLVEVSNRRPIRYGIVQEDSPFIDAERLPSVVLSSRPEGAWKDFAADIVLHQETELEKAKSALPEKMKSIVERAKILPPDKRMATVSTMVAEGFRYFGDWRRRSGGHLPRSLAEIAETGYGDCKDLSLAVVAIARAMGLKAELAWVWRGEIPLSEMNYKLPSEASFNHAIARVEDGGEVYWIDATNPVSLSRAKVFADIGGRPAFVLSRQTSRLERTPEMKPEDSDVQTKMDIRFLPSGSVLLDGSFIQRGRAAARGEAALLYLPPEQVEYELARSLSRSEKLDAYAVKLPIERTRLVRDLDFAARLEIEGIGLRTTAGLGFPLFRNETIDLLMVDGKDRFSDLWLGTPGRMTEDFTIKNARIVGKENLNCSLKNDYVLLSRDIRQVSVGVRVATKIEVFAPLIPNAAFADKTFQRFQRSVRDCFNRSAVILSVSKVKQSN